MTPPDRHVFGKLSTLDLLPITGQLRGFDKLMRGPGFFFQMFVPFCRTEHAKVSFEAGARGN